MIPQREALESLVAGAVAAEAAADELEVACRPRSFEGEPHRTFIWSPDDRCLMSVM